MFSQPVQIESPAVVRREEKTPSPLRMLALPAAIALAIAACDFMTFEINFSILYILPLALVSRMQRPRIVWQWACVLLFLTFAGYCIDFRSEAMRGWHDLLTFRLINRGMVAVALVSSAALLHIQIGLRELIDRRSRLVHASAEEEHAFEDILVSFDRFATTILCIVLIVLVTLTDVLTPSQFNVPILFCLPLVASARIQQRWIVWAIVPVLLFLGIVGFHLGPRSLPVHIKDALVLNRAIASLVLIGLAIILHGWIGSRSR